MAEKKIGIVCTSPGYGGLEMYTLQLAIALQQRGWRVAMLLNEQSKLYALSKGLFDVSSIQDFQKNKNHSAVVRKWNRKERCGLLFTPYNKDIKPLTAYKRLTKATVKLVYQQHMKVGVRKRDIIHRLRYNMLDLWITPLEYLQNETVEKTTVKKEKIRIVTVGLELKKFQNDSISKEEARQKISIPQEAFVIGVLGRIDPKKGQDFLIKTMSILNQKNIHLLIMGDITAHEGGDWIAHLHALVESGQLQNRVHFRAYEENVLLFYKAIDVFAMPSHGETYGLVTLEAMYLGKPVIGADRDGTTALLENGKLGWLYELEDMEEFKHQLSDIINDREHTQTILKEARAAVVNKYDFESTAREMDLLLSELFTTN